MLTVVRNAETTIHHTLDSFFAQEYSDKEIVIVDGASTDRTLEIVRNYPQDGVRLRSEPDRGMYDALNKALKICSGDGIGVLNSDDTFHDQFALSRIADGLGRSDIVYGHLNFVEDHVTKAVVRRWLAEERPARGFKSGWMPAHPTFYVRRAVAKKVGWFDESFKIAADYDWMLRAVEAERFHASVIDHVLVDMMRGGMSSRGVLARLAHNIEALKSRRRWLDAGMIDYAFFAKPLRKIRQFTRQESI